eukprot:m.21321 g.21321  ORF g.21321 m.21321 type:complete len:568 (+) comp5678_c0_seq1:208-1911(+)
MERLRSALHELGLLAPPVPVHIVLFSRVPTAGTTKTRLIPALGPDGAARAQLVMTEHMIEVLGSLPNVALTLHYNGEASAAEAWLRPKRARFPRLRWAQQPPGGLGDKMAAAIYSGLCSGYTSVLIVGSDIPGVCAEDINTAVAMLHGGTPSASTTSGGASGVEMVLGPAKDGGYYTVGLTVANRRAPRSLTFYRRLFSGEAIAWGTGTVRSEQLAQAAALGVSAQCLPATRGDVDEPEDLVELEKALRVTAEGLRNPGLSVVIPTLNEAGNIEAVIRRALAASSAPPAPSGTSTSNLGGEGADNQRNSRTAVLEVIVTDGGSTDSTCAVVERLAAELSSEQPHSPPIRLVEGPKGRGRQLNLGARAAQGEMLLFLHADTALPGGFPATVRRILWSPGVALGAFAFGLDCNHPLRGSSSSVGHGSPAAPASATAAAAIDAAGGSDGVLFRLTMRFLEAVTNVRSGWLAIPYGDQAFFLRRDVFWQHGGFNTSYPMMEDLDLVQRVKRGGVGRVMVDNGDPAVTSARRWREHPLGLIGVSGVNQLALFAFNVLGMSPVTIASWYRRLV